MTGEAVSFAPMASSAAGSAACAPRDRGIWAWDADFGVFSPIGQCSHTDPHTGRTESYDFATWSSPEVEVGGATDVIASWTATTPPGTWLQVDMRGVTERGDPTKGFVLGRWSADDTPRRTSVSGQGDRHGDVLVDRFVAADGHALTRLELSVTLYRPAGGASTPQLRSVAVVATRATRPTRPTRPTGPSLAGGYGQARGVVLDVPRYSQHVHRREYPHWGGGGGAWCSPTCVAMVLAFWGCGPTAQECAWVDPAFADPCVHHAVRGVYDHDYRGAGNWVFNIAYAGQRGLRGFVTKLHSLGEAEALVAAGVPLVLSVAGHLLVLVGFTSTGNPVVNDPASPSNDEVRKIVDRRELESAWQTSSQGVAYVIHPASLTLPVLPGSLP